MSLCSTYRMPCRHCRSGTGRGPGAFSGQGGSSGSISAHRSSSTIHGLVLTPSRTAESSHRSRPTRGVQQDRVTSSKDRLRESLRWIESIPGLTLFPVYADGTVEYQAPDGIDRGVSGPSDLGRRIARIRRVRLVLFRRRGRRPGLGRAGSAWRRYGPHVSSQSLRSVSVPGRVRCWTGPCP